MRCQPLGEFLLARGRAGLGPTFSGVLLRVRSLLKAVDGELPICFHMLEILECRVLGKQFHQH